MTSANHPSVLYADNNKDSCLMLSIMPELSYIEIEHMTDSKTILCVEDDQDCCDLLQFVFESEGFKVFTCSTSTEALHLAGEIRFSVIILDNRLANISGVEICRQIRTYDQQTPIIFFTASAYPKDREEGLEAGANEYLTKPNDFDKLVPTIVRIIKESEPLIKFSSC